MTMVAGCKFKEGGVLIADSRVTYGFRNMPQRQYCDRVQKILPLAERIVIGYAGDIPLVEKLIRELHPLVSRQANLRIPAHLAGKLTSIARHHHQAEERRRKESIGVELILAGVSRSGKAYFWSYSSPDYEMQEVKDFAVIGSGKIVEEFVRQNHKKYDDEKGTLKEKADLLRFGLEGELDKQSEETIGGMLQILLLDSTGITPLPYGFIEINPEGPAKAMKMDWENGQWVQKDTQNDIKTPLVTPNKLVAIPASELRIQDYEPQPPAELKWYLGHFLTCLEIESNPTDLKFDGLMTSVVAPGYPLEISILAPISFWGTAGVHEFSIAIEMGGQSSEILREKVEVPFLLEELELLPELHIKTEAPGMAFLECFMDGELLARRPFLFAELQGMDEAKEHTPESFAALQNKEAQKQLRSSDDPVLEKDKSVGLVYFSVCRESKFTDATLSFEGQIKAVYWNSYPLGLKCQVVAGLRLSKGQHQMRLELVNAATRKANEFATITMEGVSSCIITPTIADVIILIPEPGCYYVNLYVNDRFITSAFIFAEDAQPRFSYSLFPEDIEKIKGGKLLILPIRSQQKNAIEA